MAYSTAWCFAAGKETAGKEERPGSRKKDLDIVIVLAQPGLDQHIGFESLWPEAIVDQSGWKEGSADSSHLDVVCHLCLYDVTSAGALWEKNLHDDVGSS